jgi:hypothetical protein
LEKRKLKAHKDALNIKATADILKKVMPSQPQIPVIPKRSFIPEHDIDETDDEEHDVKPFGREQFGPLASPYLNPYVYDTRKLDTQYGFVEMETIL